MKTTFGDAAFASSVASALALLLTLWGVAEGGARRSEATRPGFGLVIFTVGFAWAYACARFGVYRIPAGRMRVPPTVFRLLSNWTLAAGLFIAAALVHFLA